MRKEEILLLIEINVKFQWFSGRLNVSFALLDCELLRHFYLESKKSVIFYQSLSFGDIDPNSPVELL